MSPFSSKSVRRKKVKITVTFVRRSKIAERSKHRVAMLRNREAIVASRASRSDAIEDREAMLSKHREAIKASRSDVIEDRGAIEASRSDSSKLAKIAKRCYRSIARRCSRGIADDDAPVGVSAGAKRRSPPRASSSSDCRCPPGMMLPHLTRQHLLLSFFLVDFFLP